MDKAIRTDHLKRQINDLSLKKSLTVSEQSYFFSRIRQLLENESLKDDYPIFVLFSDWTLHPTIDRSDLAGKILYHIFLSLDKMNQNNNSLLGTILILKSLRFRELFEDIQNILKRFDLSTNIVDYGIDVFGFFNQLIKELLLGNTLTLNPKMKNHMPWLKKICNDSTGKEILNINSFTFYKNPQYSVDSPKEESEYYLSCTNINNVTMQIPLEFNLWQIILGDDNYLPKVD